MRDADLAMYRAKRAGKSRCEVSDTAMHANALKRLRLETDLRKALDQKEFRVYYQPIVSLQTGKITGFEALTRWQRPEGIVPPIEFIGVAEEIGAHRPHEPSTVARSLPASPNLAGLNSLQARL